MAIVGSLLLITVANILAGCGSKTGLLIDAFRSDGGLDATRPDMGFRDAGPDMGMECIPFVGRARLASLDIFLAMDSSGSMLEETSSGATKAEAITDAVGGFVLAPESEGIGIALSFFPIEDLAVPALCESDTECGVPGTCLELDFCAPSGTGSCRTSADCLTPGDTCVPLGVCGADATDLCLPTLGVDCASGARCRDFGICENHISCRVSDYTAPAVPYGLLPSAGAAVLSAMSGRELRGGTPTLPALQGAVAQAISRSRDNPASKVIVLLATDGFPSVCDEAIDPWVVDPRAGIDNVAAAAAAGTSSGIQTFVIGVFGPEDEVDARANLTTIARAGGTDEALVITTEEPVAVRLLAILNELRRSVRTCVYAIPHAGVLPDPRDLRVRILPPAAAPIELERRASAADCDPVAGGFYFEEASMPGARPGYIELCPASCSITAASSEFIVEMQGGCEER